MQTTRQQRTQLRHYFRQLRRRLSAHQQHTHAQHMTALLNRSPAFRNAKRIACYLPEDGEINTQYLIERAWQYKKKVYLPVLPPLSRTLGHALFFAPYTEKSHMTFNRFGIAEPQCAPRHWLRARQLNLILLPLVAFDSHGNRLGMGGGFYDRSLAFLHHRKQWHSPQLIGLAHELQKAEHLPSERWDIPLNKIATEKTIYSFPEK